MKKVVVLFPYPEREESKITTVGQKIFETATEDEFLLVDNTEQGCLIIRCDAKLPKYQTITLAVFKEWIYWERLE